MEIVDDIQQYVEWDENSFHRLYKNYYKALVNYARQITDNNEAAEDVVQDVIAKLWENKNYFATLISLEVYLYNSTRNRAVDLLRHKKVKETYIKKLSEQYKEFHVDDDNIFTEDVYRMLFKTIDSLPRRSREVILMSIKGKKNKEIAEGLGISSESVKTYKQRGMEILRRKMSDEALLLLLILTMDL